MNEGLEQAITIAGGQSGLARLIKEKTGKYVSHQAVQQWCAAGRVPLGRVLDVIRAVQNKVTREQLRPDFFGEIEQGDCEEQPNGTEAKPRESTGHDPVDRTPGAHASQDSADATTINQQAA